MINNTDSLYPKTITFRHAKVGTTNSACRVGVIDSSGGVPLWFDPSKVNSRDHYIARMEWAGSEEIVIQWLNRLQNIDFVMLCDIGTGEIRTVLTEKDEAWVSVQDITWIDSGRSWRKSIYRQVGILAAQDQAAALRQMLEDRPYIDSERIGIWGWSGGGQMSLNMIFRYPELYNTAMAVAFVSHQLLYDTMNQERYMGLPADNEEGYTNGSPITHASKLEGNLLIVHGTGDDNVHYQSFERLVNELVKHNKIFTMMAYPNRSHGISEGENTTRHLFSLLTRYLLTNMPPGTKLQ